jgi:hypothetical protein
LGFALLSPTYDFASSEVLSTFNSKRLLVESQVKDGRSGVSNLRPCHGCEHTGDAAITDDRTVFSKVRPWMAVLESGDASVLPACGNTHRGREHGSSH